MTDAEMIEAALALAVAAHRGQRDKGGTAYILHPVRVMTRLSRPAEQAVALLHDVVEDCGVTLDDLRGEGFPEAVLTGVAAMTRRAGESYEAFIERTAAHPLARRVKRADIADNMDVTRLGPLAAADLARLRRYQAAHARLAAGDD